MAEILFVSRNVWAGPAGDVLKYAKGDPITVQEDGFVWGSEEGPNRPPDSGGLYAVLQIPGLAVSKVEPWIHQFSEPSQPGDPNFNNPDPGDRIEVRWRRKARLAWDEVPQQKIDNMRQNGIASATEASVRAVFRKLGWNGSAVDLTADEAIDP